MEFIMDLPNHAAGILAYCKKTKRYLLTKRGPHITEPNTWTVLGGGMHVGEMPMETAIREFYEEGGVYVPIKLIPSYISKKNEHTTFKYFYFIGFVDYEFKPKCNVVTVDGDIEIVDFGWFTIEQLLNFKKGTLHWGIKEFLKNNKKQLDGL